MKWIEEIRAKIGSFMLNRKTAELKRFTAFCKLSDAKRIGILYDATLPSSYSIIKDFADELMPGREKIVVLGYVNDKRVNDNYLYRQGFDFFTKADLNWFYKPVTEITDYFINEPFDILFNLCLKDYYPVKYITALSAAKFKTGRFSPSDKNLDLMIDINRKNIKNVEEDNLTSELSSHAKSGSATFSATNAESRKDLELKMLIEQLLYYLSTINN